MPAVGLPTPPTKKPGIHVIVKGSDTVQYRMLDSPSSLAPSSILDDTYRSEKTNGLAPRRSGSSVNDMDASSHRLLATPSTLAPSSSLDDSHAFRRQSSGRTGEAAQKRANSNVATSRENLASISTGGAASTTRLNGILPRDSKPVFPLAVKARIYSDSRYGGRRNTSSGSQRLDACGFTPATKPAARTANSTKRDAASISTTAPTPTSKPKPKSIATPKMTIKRLKKEAEESVQPQSILSPVAPRTPRQPQTGRRASNWSSPSIGTPGDPYMLSSDSGSDSDGDDNATTDGQSHDPRSLKSFANITDIHETASDVEAVLDQFPAWLTTPSPPEPRTAYRSVPSSQTSTVSRLSVRARAGEDGNRGSKYRESRRVRFSGGDGFSPSPVPLQRTTAPIERTSSRAKRIDVLSKASPPHPGRIASLPDRIVKSEFTLDEHTSGSFNGEGKDEHPIQHGGKMLLKKRKRALSGEEKRASRHRNVDRGAWRRKKKVLKALKALKAQKARKIKREP
ncbi:hypothetical protein O1611_g10069 [Lasiodiplodia mahajangana]|uniref:Uncharacterized protein n=1 Tax=Lasiodiplodia mahajangana TaxID=1108764 RepID=A0ACC2J2F8_9PEZI|nr:hypothetical protein O1611_g10069 [Lasiodiplodia mahajangana]